MKVGQGEAAYWAFVPHPLPPRLDFDCEFVSALSEADRALGELSGLGRTVANPSLFIGPFIHREAVLSSRIEGTQTGITDLYAYEAGQISLSGSKSVPPESDVREVLNYVHALEYGLERINELPISLRLIREIHARLLDGVRGNRYTPGEFRQTQNWIGPSGCSLGDATYVPPPVGEMHDALGALEGYLHVNGGYPPLVRIALVHQHFEAIHPFLDGNGRIGRLLISLLLVHWNLLPMPLLYLSAYFENHRQEYYDRLLAVTEHGDWRGWLLYFLQGVAEQSADVVGRAKRLQDLQIEYQQAVRSIRTTKALLDLVDLVFRQPAFTVTMVQRLLGVNYPTARRNIGKLVEAGILVEIGRGQRNRAYASPGVLQAIAPNEESDLINVYHPKR